ncbi:hypothetical protein JY651_42560 [Pyxidicoccus parkwayensis]|uniref:SnoaL-like domain-containing protein n=1 Tax=Pyxidicoccus parkwayensis TaxID=2813578 RepID=A0ABX7NST6_9BACT|nr:hypothetical protein [Pyxidicoccus parkwaysis]QSQ21768.1 hypothetical protein JY651_42560 [Pyxidicoccus parkwaysis]
MGTTKQLADEFLGWWSNPESNPGFPRRFAQGFTFTMEPVGLADSGAVWLIEQAPPWSEVKVKSQEVEGDTARIVIEGVDPVTLLRLEISWKLVIQEERIVSVLQHGRILE